MYIILALQLTAHVKHVLFCFFSMGLANLKIEYLSKKLKVTAQVV